MEFGEVVDLPPQQEGVVLIVSGMVKSALSRRADLAVPTNFVRDEKGNIIGAKGLRV